nr:hypothetical protein [Tanacetum cinerariifolium]
MATTIEQQVALDEALVPSTKRLRIGRSNFRLPSDIQSKEPTLFKMDTRKNIVDLEAFREMLHISPRVPDQSFDEVPFEEEILDFLRFLGHSAQKKTLTDVNVNKLFQPWRSFAAVINNCQTKKSSSFDSLRDDILFSTIKVVSRHQNTQQYGAILPIELTTEDIRNTKAYKEYYACATGEAAPKTKASARRKRGGFDSSTTPPTAVASSRPIITVAAALRLTHGGSSTDEGIEETREEEEESFNLIPRTPEDSQVDGNGEEDQGLRVSEEQRLIEEEEVDELYSDVDINQGRGLQVSQDVEDSHVTLTSVQPDGHRLFRFEERVKSLEVNFSEFMQTNQFAESVSKIPGIVHQYMTQQMREAVREAVQIQTDRLQDSFQRENDEFLRTIDENMKKTIKGKVKTDLTEMELKKILIEKIEGNKSIQRSDEQRNLYKALVNAYEADKTILESYGDTAILKGTCVDYLSDRRTPTSVFDTGVEDQPIVQTSQHPEWFSQPRKPPTPNRDWNKTLPAIQGSAQTWISELAKQADSCSSFNELLDTLIDFFNFIMNWLGVDTLTPELLAGPTYELMRGSCTSLTELEYHLEEPLPLIPDNQGHRVIPFAHFINNDLEYLRGGASSRKYTTYVTKTKAIDYEHIKWIEDLVPRTTWIQEPLNYDKHALWEVSRWGRKRQQFYEFAVNQESALDVYSKRRIIAVTDLKIVEWHYYKHLDWILVRRDDDKIYKFKEGDFKRLRLQDIEDMLLLLVQGKLSNLTVEERFAFNVSIRMFTRSIVIQRRVQDLQLGVKSYQKRLNLTKPDTYRSDLKRGEAYTAYSNPRGFIYQNKDKKNRLMRINKLYKFIDGTLNDVYNALDDHLKGIRMQYLPQAIWRKGDKDRAAAMIQSIDKMLKTQRIMKSLERFVGGRLYEGDFRMLQRTI